MSQQPVTIDEYIAASSEQARPILRKIRQIMLDTAPQFTESISYGMPTFSLNGKHCLYFAAWKNHIAVYPIYGDGGRLKDKLKPYMQAKDALHFPIGEPFPYDLMREIVLLKLEEHGVKA
jgi:uncharacterized protein YdhG (YjbR/CyaY superfamily)